VLEKAPPLALFRVFVMAEVPCTSWSKMLNSFAATARELLHVASVSWLLEKMQGGLGLLGLLGLVERLG